MNRNDPVLVKFRASEHSIGIRTVTRRRKSPYSFELPRERLADLEADGWIAVNNAYSSADLRLTDSGSRVRIDFVWLIRDGGGTWDDGGPVRGFSQTVTLDYGLLARHIRDSRDGDAAAEWSMLSVDRTRRRPRLDFGSEDARRTIRKVLAVPVLRHKLTRAVRDNFQWPGGGSTIRFYGSRDPYSFLFREYRDGREGTCGGLVLHRHADMAKDEYYVHT